MSDDAATATGAPRAVDMAGKSERLTTGYLIAKRYRLERLLGRGGMGQVWLAQDMRLARAVAIKVLAPEFSSDPHLRARMEREARVISTLVHPHICALHDVGHDDGIDFLVMEYLEGLTLARRLQKGRLSINEVLSYGAQIAEALAHAHDKGIVHRDLKPSNVMITKSGAKLLDFGLAKSKAIVTSDLEGSAGPTAEKPLTGEGHLIGTLSYMAPEQLEGKEADARTDIFALGTVLYLMATGRRPFNGDSDASVIASILKETPRPVHDVVPLVPSALDHIVHNCLIKDPDQRWQCAHDAAQELRWIAEAHAPELRPSSSRRWAIAAALAGIVLGFGAAFFLHRSAERPHLTAARQTQLTFGSRLDFAPALSPDGTTLAFVRRLENRPADIYVQRVGGTNPVNITSDCPRPDAAPSFSPDSKQISYYSQCDAGIYVIGATGESRRRVTTFGRAPAAWSPDGRELAFVSGDLCCSGGQLWSVDVATLQTRFIAASENVRHPTWSPNKQWIAFAMGAATPQALAIVPAKGGKIRELFRDAHAIQGPAWSRDGSYIYFIGTPNGGSVDTLWRLPIDAVNGAARGAPQQVMTAYVRSFSLAADGRHIAYATGIDTYSIGRLPVNRKSLTIGAPVTLFELRQQVAGMAPSPDEQWIALETTKPTFAISTIARDGTNIRRLTDDTIPSRGAIWTPDGLSIMFLSTRDGRDDVWMMDREGSRLERLTNNSLGLPLLGFGRTSDGKRLFVTSRVQKQVTGTVDLTRPLSERSIEWLPAIGPGQGFQGSYWSPDGKKIVGKLRLDPRAKTPDVQIDQGAYVYDVTGRTVRKIASGVMGDPLWYDDNTILLSYYPEVKSIDLRTLQLRPAFTFDVRRGGGIWRVSDDRSAIYISDVLAEGNIYMLELLEDR